MKLILVFASIVLAYLAPMYFFGDLSMPMLLEAGVRSGIIVTVCKWASQDFSELLIIVYLELILILCCAIIIADWHTHYFKLDYFISEINAAVFWLEIGILTIFGSRRIGAYIRNDLHNSNPNLRGNDR